MTTQQLLQQVNEEQEKFLEKARDYFMSYAKDYLDFIDGKKFHHSTAACQKEVIIKGVALTKLGCAVLRGTFGEKGTMRDFKPLLLKAEGEENWHHNAPKFELPVEVAKLVYKRYNK